MKENDNIFINYKHARRCQKKEKHIACWWLVPSSTMGKTWQSSLQQSNMSETAENLLEMISLGVL